MFLLLRSLMHEYTIMKWLAGLPPLFALPYPLTSPDSFTRGCFFTFPLVAVFSLFHPWMIFCFFTRRCFFAFFTRGCFLLSCCDHRLCFHHLCFCASTTRLGLKNRTGLQKEVVHKSLTPSPQFSNTYIQF